MKRKGRWFESNSGRNFIFNARIAQMVEKNYLFIVFFMLYIGDLAEWSIAPVLKTGGR